MSLSSQPAAIRQHPATSALYLGPYVAHGIQVEWYGERGQGPYRGELEKLSAERPYVKGYKHSQASFDNLLPVLRPFGTIATLYCAGRKPLAGELAKLLLGAKPEENFNYRVEPQDDGAVVHVTAQGRDQEPVRYCKVVITDSNFLIQGPHGEFWALQNVLPAYELLREHHVAVGLSPGQYVAL